MPGRRESGRDVYIDPASIPTHRGSLDLSVNGQDFDLNHPLTFSDSLSTISNSAAQSGIPNSLSHIDPSFLEEIPNIHGPQFGTVIYPSQFTFPRPDLPRHPKTPFQVGHGSSVPEAAPWDPVAVVDQSMTYSRTQPSGGSRQSNQKQPTDSGYASSFKSNPYASSSSPQSYMASYPTDAQSVHVESRESRMQQVLPDQASALSRKTSHSQSKAKSVTSFGDNLPDSEELACSMCAVDFSTKSEYTKHMARHKKEFKCDVVGCKKTDGFATQNDLDRHLRSVHHKIGSEVQVWKCFVGGCKSSDKEWPRRDNFKAHIERMHRGVGVDEYIKRSEDWFDEIEKPRRQQLEAHMLAGDSSLTEDTGASRLNPVSNNQYYPDNVGALSPNDHMNSRHSVAGEFPYSGSGSQPPAQFYMQGHLNLALPNQFPNTARSFSNTANASTSNVASANQYYQADSTNPAIRTNDMSDRFGDDTFYPQHVPVGSWDCKTMPEIGQFDGRFPLNYSPNHDGDKHLDEDMLSLIQADSNMFLHMGPPDDSSLPAPNAIPQDITDLTNQPAPISSIVNTPSDGDDHAELLRQKVAEAVRSIHGVDEALVQELSRVVQQYSSSRAGISAKDDLNTANVEIEKPYECDWIGCTKRFGKKNACAKHRKRHDKRWFCTFDDCYKRFGSKQDMQRHEATCNTQEGGWRCWCKSGSKAANKDCPMFCTDIKKFEKHGREDHHGYSRRSADEFKVERDFAGQFWCGFCNAVIANPIPGGYDGTARLKYRYDHIEKHLNENENKTMADWYDLKGEGKTKKERCDISRKIIAAGNNDDDDDEGDEDEPDNDGQPSAASSASMPKRQRSETAPGSRPQFLAPPSSGSSHGMKRPSPEGFSHGRNFRPHKVPRLQQPQNVPSYSASLIHPNATLSMSFQPNQRIVAWIGCCVCSSRPRPNNGQKQCSNSNCDHQVCASCRYWDRQGTPIFPNQNTN